MGKNKYGIYGLLWVRDKETESFNVTISNGYARYKEKYNENPTYIECSEKDSEKEFEYLTAMVVPSQYCNKGVIWITGKNFENG